MIFASKMSFPRALLAVCAALIATCLCAGRYHVRIDLADASTYASPFQHRCGLLMVVCVAWAVGEVVLYFQPAIQRRFSEM